MKIPKHVLPVIIISQFCCTSLWFAGNGVMNNLVTTYNLQESALGNLTSAVQFGFIAGTLVFALFTIADRFSPSKVFFISAILGAFFNIAIIIENQTLFSLLSFRFFTGFFLAGIYPVGMKIATDYYDKGLGKSLGFLVGALVLGTALPHLLKNIMQDFPWENVIITTSSIASIGGFLMLILVKDGPFRTKSKGLDLSICFSVFKNTAFRKAAFGYFGHMWELYTFWTFVPIILHLYAETHKNVNFNISLFSFLIIASGAFACVLGGYLATRFTAKKVAFYSLFWSCICCLISPLFFLINFEELFLSFLFFWGMVVIADSPLFSTLVAQNASSKNKGTALTIVNSIGFAITIVSIQVLTYLFGTFNSNWSLLVLAIGPILGLINLKTKRVNP